MDDLISRKALVTKLSQGYWDWNLQQGKNDPCVIDAMIDWAIRIVKEMPIESPWHKGTPTEEGWYLLCNMANNKIFYDTDYYENGDWKYCCILRSILAWWKIEPYKED